MPRAPLPECFCLASDLPKSQPDRVLCHCVYPQTARATTAPIAYRTSDESALRARIGSTATQELAR